jgi:hypothetical protein
MANKTDNRIRFESKEQSNDRRITEALNRTPDERFQFFLSLIEEFSLFKHKGQNIKNQNFIIKITNH